MKIAIFLLYSFVFLFSNVDNLIGDFESGYMNAEKKMSKSKSLNKRMMTKNKTHRDNMSDMNNMNSMSDINKMNKTNKMSSIDMTMKNQQLINNKENILKAINKEIEAYIDGLVPTILVISLFVTLILMMYVIISAMNASGLKHKISVLENLLSDESEGGIKSSSNEYDFLSNHVKKINLRLDSAEAVIHRLLYKISGLEIPKPVMHKKNESKDSKKTIDNKKDKDTSIKKEVKEKTNIDDLIIDDDFAMDEADDEELLSLDADDNEKSSTPLSNLSALDMDIDTADAGKKKNKKNLKDMEDFSLNDFDE